MLSDADRAELDRLNALADEETENENRLRDERRQKDREELDKRLQLVRMARDDLQSRCGSRREMAFADPHEGIEVIGPMLDMLCACVSALERRIAALESKA